MESIKNFIKNYLRYNKKGLRYEASTLEMVWDRTSAVARCNTTIL